MDSESGTETIVEESVDLCHSPTILSGLYQIQRMSTKAHSIANSNANEQDVEQICPLSQDSDDDSISLCLPVENQQEHRDDFQQDEMSPCTLSQQSELSPSIFTQRVSSKRRFLISQPDSPVLEQVPVVKSPRLQESTFNSSDDTHLISQGLCAPEEAPQSPSLSFGPLRETQSTTSPIQPLQQTHNGSEDHASSSYASKEKSLTTPSAKPSPSPEIQRESLGFSRDTVQQGSEAELFLKGGARTEKRKYPQSSPLRQTSEHPSETVCTNLENQSCDFDLSSHQEHVQNKTSLNTLPEEAATRPLKLQDQKSLTATTEVEPSNSFRSTPPSSNRGRLTSQLTPNPTSVNLENSEPTFSKLKPETQPTSNRTSFSASLRSKSLETQNSERSQRLEDEDDASMIEVEEMQMEMKDKLKKKQKCQEDYDQVKKSFQDMQAKLRHLSTKQRGLRSQLSIKLKQQQGPSNSSNSQSQDTKSRLQCMLTRQQHLLKLLQAHKELAATLVRTQKTECDDFPPSLASEPPTNVPRKRISSNVHQAKNSVLPTEKLYPSSPTSVPPSNSETHVANQTRMTPTPWVSKTITPRKSIPEVSTGKTFKPPFKANQPTSLSSEQSRHRLGSLRSPGRTLDDAATTQDMLGVDQDMPFSAAAILVEEPSSRSPVERTQSPPFSPSSRISNDTVITETTGVLYKKQGTICDPPSQNAMNNSQQIPFEISKDHVHVATDKTNTPEPNQLLTEMRAPRTEENDASCEAQTQPFEEPSVCAQSQPKRSPTKLPDKTTTPELNAIINQLLKQLQNKASSTTQNATDADQMPAASSNKPKQVTLDVHQIPPANRNYQAVLKILTQNPSRFSTAAGRVSLTQAPLRSTSTITKTGTTPTQLQTVSNNAQTTPNDNQKCSSRYTTAPLEFQTSTSSARIPAQTNCIPSIPVSNLVATSVLTETATRCLQEAPGAKNVPSLKDLLQKGLVKPGVNVLSIKSKNKTVNASINADGTVMPVVVLKNFSQGSLWQMLSALKRKSVSSQKESPRVWKLVSYLGKPLDKLFAEYKALTARNQLLEVQPNLESTIFTPIQPTTTFFQASSVTTQPRQRNQDSIHPPQPIFPNNPSASCHATSQTGNNFHPSEAEDACTSPRTSLAASMRRVLLISDDELIPVSCGVSANFWRTENIQEASICPEWIEEMDVWTSRQVTNGNLLLNS